MGNRAVITIKENYLKKEYWPSLYLHWNGGRDTVEPLLHVAELYKIRCDDYGVARLCQIMGNYFGGTLSVGVGVYCQYNGEIMDNGIYIVENWKIIERENAPAQEQKEHDFKEMTLDIREKNDKFFLDD